MLCRLADALDKGRGAIRAANEADIEASRGKIPDALLHRLTLSDGKLDGAIEGLRAVAALPCPVGRVKERRLLDEGLELEKVTYPLGVIGMVFEARPDALVQIVSLALKSANGLVLKGGREADRTNRAIVDIIRDCLDGAPWLMLLSSHGDVDEMLSMEGLVDLVIPRGSNAFVRYVMDHTHIPVMGHADGICSVYVDKSADLDEAVKIVVDSKTQYPAACNAAETVLVHQDIAASFLPRLAEAFASFPVQMHCDEASYSIIGGCGHACHATDEDWDREYLALECAIKMVASADEAIGHIARHSSHHTDAIVCQDDALKQRFFREVDSADVFCNCSTRFADGFRFGLGAEVGISTSKIHARGPVGLEGLTTTKWQLSGSGQVVKDYAEGRSRFLHKELPL